MATIKSQHTVNTINHNTPNRPRQKVETKNKTPLIIIIVIIVFIMWAISGFWPISFKTTSEKLDEVLDACTNNEYSSECQKIKKKYNMSFKYCKSFADGVGKFEDGYYISAPYYPVAWEGTSAEPPEKTIKIGEKETRLPSTYYSCTDHVK